MIINIQFLDCEPKLVDESYLNHWVLCFYQVDSSIFLLCEPLRSYFTLFHKKGPHFPQKGRLMSSA